jgi:hypothetical protein
LKNKANFELLKKILTGSRADSLQTEINPLMNNENENENDNDNKRNLKIKIKGEENIDLKENYSPIQLIRRLNNQRQKYEKKSQMTKFKDKNDFEKQIMMKENNYDTADYEDEKNNNLHKLLMNNRIKYRNYNSIKDEEKNISSSNNIYKEYKYNLNNNNTYKFKFNNHEYEFSINGNNESTSEYLDLFNEYNKNNSRMKSYIINSSMNDNKSTNNKSINNKIKSIKSPVHSKYSGLSEKIISFNNLYNSIQNKIESYRENHERKNKFEKINVKNLKNVYNSTEKRNIKKNGKKIKRLKMNIKSAEHRTKTNKKLRQENNLKYTSSDLNKNLKTLNSKNNVRSLENYTLKNQYPELNNNKICNSMSKRNKNTQKIFKKHNHNQKKIDSINIGGKKYDIQEIIKRRGLNKNYITENNKY